MYPPPLLTYPPYHHYTTATRSPMATHVVISISLHCTRPIVQLFSIFVTFSHPTAAAFADQESVDALLGVQRAEYERRMRERLATRQQRLAEGFTEEECDKLEAEEETEFRKKRNILAELDGVFEKVNSELYLSIT